MEERKMCYVGRYSDRHVGTVLPSHDISDKWCSSGSGGRQENCQVRSTNTVVLVCANCCRNHRSHQESERRSPNPAIGCHMPNKRVVVVKEFLSDLGRRITQMTNEKRLSMVIQRYNAVAI